MAATGKTPILLYGSTTSSNVPVAGNLTNSSDGCEIAINVADKNLFFKDSTNVVNTVPIRQSSASSNGWLSSTDWATFNNKVSSQWVTTGSNIYYTTGNVGIGTNNPTYKLVVQGSSGNTYTKIARDAQSTGEVGVYLAGGTSGVDWYVYQPVNNNELRFYSTSDKFVLDTSGNATIKNGNLVIGTSGKGIDFSATADATATSELLADYEEGTWTPTYTSSTGAFGTITYGLQQGTYTKVGRLVTISCYMRTNSVAAGTAGGSLQIAGLPYTPSSFIYAGTLSFSSGFYNNVNPLTISIQTDGKIYLYYRPTVTDVSTLFSAVAGTTGLNTTTTNGLNYVQFQITYQI